MLDRIIQPDEAKQMVSKSGGVGGYIKTVLKKQYSRQNVIEQLDPLRFVKMFTKTYLINPETKQIFPASPLYEMRKISKLPIGSQERRKKERELATSLAIIMSTPLKPVKGLDSKMARSILKVKKGATETEVKSAWRIIQAKEYPRTVKELAKRNKVNAAKIINEARDVLLRDLKPPKIFKKPTELPKVKYEGIPPQVLRKAEMLKPEDIPLPKGKELPTKTLFKEAGMKPPAPKEPLLKIAEKPTKIVSPEEIKKMVKPKVPETLYHGGSKEITKFEPETRIGGVYLTKNKEYAKTFGKVITKATADIKKPYDLTREVIRQPERELLIEAPQNFPNEIASLRKQGYDAIVHKNQILVLDPNIVKVKPEVKPVEKIAVEEEKILAEARGEMKAEKLEAAEAKTGEDLRWVARGLKATKEGVWTLPKTYPKDHVLAGQKVPWDEFARDLGYSGETIEPGPGIQVLKDFYDDIVVLKGGQPLVPKKEVIMPKVSKARAAKLKNTAEALGLEKEFYKVMEGLGIDLATIPSYKRLKPYKPAEAVEAKPTKKVKAKIKERKIKVEEKTQAELYKKWQDSYKSETLTPTQALNKAFTQAKKLTDQGVKDRLSEEVARVFAPDYRTPEYVFEKFALKDKIYTPLKTGQERSSRELRKYTERSNEWWKNVGKNNKARKTASKKIFQWLDGKDIQLADNELQVATEIKDYLAKWADRLDLPEDRRIANYITHIFEPDFEEGKRIFPEELAKILDYVTPNKEFNPFLEKRLGAKGYKEDVFEALDAYVYRASRKVHLDKLLNQASKYVDALPLQASRYTDKFLKNFKNRPLEFEKWVDQNLLQGLSPKVRNYLGNRPASKMAHLVTTQIYRGTLGFNVGPALKNLTQFVNTYAELGEKYTIIGYSQLMARGVKELKDNDVLSDMVIADYKNTSLRSGLRKMDNALFWFFETAEKINRGSAYYAQKQKSLDEGLSEEEAISKAKEIVRKTQFAYGKLGMPLALQTPGGRLMFTLATYPLKQFEFLSGYARKREWAKLARYIASSFVLVATVGKFLGIDYKDVFFKNIMPTLGIVPKAVKSLFEPEWKRDKAMKNIIKILTIPGYGGLKKVGQVFRGESRTAKGKLRFKIETPEDIIKTLLTGEWSTSGAEKYLIKKGIIGERTFIDDLLYIITGKKEYAPKKKKSESASEKFMSLDIFKPRPAHAAEKTFPYKLVGADKGMVKFYYPSGAYSLIKEGDVPKYGALTQRHFGMFNVGEYPSYAPNWLATEEEPKKLAKGKVYPTPVDDIINKVFGSKADNARRVLKWGEKAGEGENQGYITGKGWNDYNYDARGKVKYITNILTGEKEKSEDRGLFRINNFTFYDFMNRKEKILKGLGITSYEDMYDIEKNIKMAKLIFNEQGWCAWHAAPEDLCPTRLAKKKKS